MDYEDFDNELLFPYIIVEGKGMKHVHHRYHLGRGYQTDQLGLAVRFYRVIVPTSSKPTRAHGPHSKLYDAPVEFERGAAVMATWLTDREKMNILDLMEDNHAEYNIYEISLDILERVREQAWGYQEERYKQRYIDALDRLEN